MRHTLTRLLPALIALALLILLIAYWQPLHHALQRLQNQWQRDLAAQLLALRRHGNDATTWLTLSSLGFLYGILHAIGPGHGKAIIATFTLSQPTARRQTLAIAIGGALMQGVSAILWVALAMGLLHLLMPDAVNHSHWLNRANAALIIAIGAYILYRHRPRRRHDAHCACGHDHHHHDAPATSALSPWAAIIAIGIRPCSGAVISLAAAWSWSLIGAGIAMTLAIACGTALTIATIALLCYHGRQHLARRLTHDGARLARLTRTLALVGGLILILLGALLWQSDSDITPAPTSNPIGLPR
ncbi:nickel/cobalt transporter [Cardiobacterium sp. Marseille-Q4385]|uniref:nickel/cobalt transporter n=1 Tax=Cardiobacterium sp. Marseille-Q4385 TaxID=2866573 RepID=UPI001CE43ACA|nr:transporter [Cardiobacterium sp. Marseille-Q4385]